MDADKNHLQFQVLSYHATAPLEEAQKLKVQLSCQTLIACMKRGVSLRFNPLASTYQNANLLLFLAQKMVVLTHNLDLLSRKH